MQAVILAAGKGTRLGVLTRERSKAMLPILGVPMIARVMESLAALGITQFILVVSPQDKAIREYFHRQPGTAYKVYWAEQRAPLGMAHALSCASPWVREDFVLSACDSWLPAREVGRVLAHWDHKAGVEAVLSLERVAPDRLSQVGVVEVDGPWVTRIVEKPAADEAPSSIASLPLYGFPYRLLSFLPDIARSSRGEYEIQSAIQALINAGGRVMGVFVAGRLNLTTPSDLLAINQHFLNSCADDYLDVPQGLSAEVDLIPPSKVESGVQLGGNCMIGPRAYLEAGCQVGKGAMIQNAVVLRSGQVISGERVVNRLVW